VLRDGAMAPGGTGRSTACSEPIWLCDRWPTGSKPGLRYPASSALTRSAMRGAPQQPVGPRRRRDGFGAG
jgi:hypothetical protein